MDPKKQLLHTHKHPLTLVPSLGHVHEECSACRLRIRDDHVYHCYSCRVSFHKDCVASFSEITHPYHPRHPMQICTDRSAGDRCFWCNNFIGNLYYRCSICDLNIHLSCASQQQLVLTVDADRNHDHPLTIFLRKIYFTCNLCGYFDEFFPIYACVQCDFMVHKVCLDLPNVIRISCHQHRISRRLDLPPREWLCGVCHLKIDSKYGAFLCTKDYDYAVHSNCAILDKVWDKTELEDVPEDEDELIDVEPYQRLDDNHIKHFSHEHHLKLVHSQEVDETSRCQACRFPIHFQNLYTCVSKKCDFVLHEECAEYKRKRWHWSHHHPLTLNADDGMTLYHVDTRSERQGFYFCSMCTRLSRGFRYLCGKDKVVFEVDVRCASMPQELQHKSHPHLLYVNLLNTSSLTCGSCRESSMYVFYCLQCPNYFMCFECATLPDEVVYKHDTHPLILCCGEQEDTKGGQYWCETCETKLDPKQWFYKCDHCCVTLHKSCLLGNSPYAKPGAIMIKASRDDDNEIDYSYPGPYEIMCIHSEEKYEVISNVTLSRPKCCQCDRRCQDSVAFKQEKEFYCSLSCLKKRKLYNYSVIFPF